MDKTLCACGVCDLGRYARKMGGSSEDSFVEPLGYMLLLTALIEAKVAKRRTIRMMVMMVMNLLTTTMRTYVHVYGILRCDTSFADFAALCKPR